MGKNEKHLYNAETGLAVWYDAIETIEANETGIIDIVCNGDSITEGSNASDPLNNGFVGRMREYYKNKYSDVGRGFFPAYYPSAGRLITLGEGWAITNTEGVGVAGLCAKSTTEGSVMSWTFNGTGIKLYSLNCGGCAYYVDISIDGAEPTRHNFYNGAWIIPAILTFDGLEDTTHTITVTNQGGGYKIVDFVGWQEIKGDYGVRVNQCGCSGAASVSGAGTSTLPCTIKPFSPKLTIINLGINDVNVNTTAANYQTYIQRRITDAQLTGDVLLVIQNPTNISSTFAAKLKVYQDLLYDLADLNDCAVFNIDKAWSSWAAANTKGFITDTVHPANKGHLDISKRFLRCLRPDGLDVWKDSPVWRS